MKKIQVSEEDKQFLDDYFTIYILITPGKEPVLFSYLEKAIETKARSEVRV